MAAFKPISTPGEVFSPLDAALSPVSVDSGQTANHDSVLALTRRLFGASPTLQIEQDPEVGTQYFVLTARTEGSVEEIVALNDRWHRELPVAAGDRADQYRLAIDTQ